MGAPRPNPQEKTPAWLQPSCSHQMPSTRPHAALWQGRLRWLQWIRPGPVASARPSLHHRAGRQQGQRGSTLTHRLLGAREAAKSHLSVSTWRTCIQMAPGGLRATCRLLGTREAARSHLSDSAFCTHMHGSVTVAINAPHRSSRRHDGFFG